MGDTLQHHLADAETSLRLAQQALRREISTYPGPISGCDAQFNHLLAERRRVERALEALEASVFIPTPRRPDRTSEIESR